MQPSTLRRALLLALPITLAAGTVPSGSPLALTIRAGVLLDG